MASLLPQLDREAMLLMYLSEELCAEDRAAVERMLAADSSLRQQLQQLRELDGTMATCFEQLDEHASPLASEGRIQRLLHDMRRHDNLPSELAARQAYTDLAPQRRVWPRWAFLTTAAASIIFLMLSLWAADVFQLPGQSGTPGGAVALKGHNGAQPAAAADPAVVRELQRSFEGSDFADPRLDEADSHLRALWGEDDDSIPSPGL